MHGAIANLATHPSYHPAIKCPYFPFCIAHAFQGKKVLLLSRSLIIFLNPSLFPFRSLGDRLSLLDKKRSKV